MEKRKKKRKVTVVGKWCRRKKKNLPLHPHLLLHHLHFHRQYFEVDKKEEGERLGRKEKGTCAAVERKEESDKEERMLLEREEVGKMQVEVPTPFFVSSLSLALAHHHSPSFSPLSPLHAPRPVLPFFFSSLFVFSSPPGFWQRRSGRKRRNRAW